MRFMRDALGWGIAIYSIMYLLWSGLVTYGLAADFLSLAIRLIAIAAMTTIAARSVGVSNWRELAPYTISWAIIAIIFDALFLVPFSGWAMYGVWSVWFGYALIALIPLFTSLMSFQPRSASRAG